MGPPPVHLERGDRNVKTEGGEDPNARRMTQEAGVKQKRASTPKRRRIVTKTNRAGKEGIESGPRAGRVQNLGRVPKTQSEQD